MTDEQINAAIAEACGWQEITNCTCGGRKRGCPPGAHTSSHIPGYCTDLNAMAEAEKILNTETQFMNYYLALYDVTQKTRWPVSATARQRAEAFLRTLGKWEEVQG